MENKSNNKLVITLLAVLIVAVLGVGGYFIVKDLNNKNNSNNSSESNSSQNASQQESSSKSTTPEVNGGQTTDSEEIEAGITYAEIRGQDFYIEAQINGQVTGTCDIYLTPVDGVQGQYDDDEIEIRNKVSICEEDFSLKGTNPGEHIVRVVIKATDGRTKTLEKTVNL